jgi:hypothetical protein
LIRICEVEYNRKLFLDSKGGMILKVWRFSHVKALLDAFPNIQSLFSEARFDDNKLEKSKFIRYMPESELLEIKNKINRVFGLRFPDENLSDKWSYLKP